MVTIPIAIATFFYGGDVISLCYGNQYAEAGEVLKNPDLDCLFPVY